MAVKDYPDEEGGLIAKMRLAEQGVHDQPSIAEMFSLFGKPESGSPEDIYTGIIRDHPASPLAPLAQIKLAMRRRWPKRVRKNPLACSRPAAAAAIRASSPLKV